MLAYIAYMDPMGYDSGPYDDFPSHGSSSLSGTGGFGHGPQIHRQIWNFLGRY